MQVEILGAGEAFDETLGNTSALVTCNDAVLLLDCGYAGPFQVWGRDASPDLLDAIYISHAHADHYFGLPALLTRMWEDGRTKPLTIISQPQALHQIRQLLDLGYIGISKRFQFAIEEIEASPAAFIEYRRLRLRFAPTLHSTTNLAIRIEEAAGSFCYSGDGMFTDESRALYSGTGLLLHEAYCFDPSPVHADIPRLIEMAAGAGVKRLVLTHVQRNVRKNDQRLEDLHSTVPVTLAAPGERFEVS
jgi:ribonuclease BN (tRNA processing enzyme)